jgi:hypothetical protein
MRKSVGELILREPSPKSMTNQELWYQGTENVGLTATLLSILGILPASAT